MQSGWLRASVVPAPAALEATARGFDDAAGGLDAQRGRIHASVAVAMPQWRGQAATAWQQHLALTASRLHAAAGALRETATVLRELARECESARATLDQARTLQVQGYELPDQLEGLAEAQRQAEAATASYHAAEQRLRARLWELGDRAPVAPPPVPPLPSVPPIPLWARALGERAPTWYWDRGRDGQALGWDEDGNVVPAARGHPRTFELTEMGFGGLLKVLPRVAGRAPVNPRTAEELVPAFRGGDRGLARMASLAPAAPRQGMVPASLGRRGAGVDGQGVPRPGCADLGRAGQPAQLERRPRDDEGGLRLRPGNQAKAGGAVLHVRAASG